MEKRVGEISEQGFYRSGATSSSVLRCRASAVSVRCRSRHVASPDRACGTGDDLLRVLDSCLRNLQNEHNAGFDWRRVIVKSGV